LPDPNPNSRLVFSHLRRLVAGILGAVLGISLGLPLSARAELRIIPSLTLSEQYDSNVVFTNTGNDDLVTVLTPALRASYRGRPLEGNLSGSLSLASYAKHSNFNYASAAGAFNVDLTQLVGQLDKRARLQLSGSGYYTPELPAFITATAGFNPFATGIQPQRVRSYSLSSSATGGYSLTSRVDLTGTYSYSYLNFGSTVGANLQTPLFKTILQTVNAGPTIKLTPADSLTLQYQYQKADYGGTIPGFHTQGGTIGLIHGFSRQLTGTVSAGATKITPSDKIAPLVNLSLSWTERNTITTFTFARSVTPSFVISSGALETNLASLSVAQSLTDRLSGTVNVNYARSSSATVTAGSAATFDSYGTILSLGYLITRSLSATFSYSHSHFTSESAGFTSSFDRDLVALSLTASWM
jgi:hypothetical protein